jgi:hypothetical protein
MSAAGLMASTCYRVARFDWVEVACVSLSSHDRNVLAWISADLSGSDPDLAAKLGAFAQLTAADEMPAREQIRPRWLRWPRWPLAWRRPGPAQILIMFWLLVAAAMVTVAVTLSGTGTAQCNPLWARACTAPTPTVTATSGHGG